MSDKSLCLELNGVSVAYAGKRALDGVTASLGQSETLAVIGPNGAGKSTIVRAICGRAPLTAGSIKILGADASIPQSRRNLGIAPQTPALYERLTSRENVICSALQMGMSFEQARRNVDRTLDLVGAGAFADKQARKLSGGMRARVNIAAAIIHQPALIILDEPTASLDPESSQQISALIRRLNNEGFAILLVSHNMQQIESVACLVVVLERGCVAAMGSPSELRSKAGCDGIEVSIKTQSNSNAMTQAGFIFDEIDTVWRAHCDNAAALDQKLTDMKASSVDIDWLDAPRTPFSSVYETLLRTNRKEIAA